MMRYFLIYLSFLCFCQRTNAFPRQADFYIVSISAVKLEQEAVQKVAELTRKGYVAGYLWIPDYPSLSGAPYYSVYVGPYGTQQECEIAVEEYAKRFPGCYGLLVSTRPERVQILGINKVKRQSAGATTSDQPRFIIKEISADPEQMPERQVSILYKGKTIPVGSYHTLIELTPKEDYRRQSVPSTAVAACGGWWAGTGDYFYIILKGDSYYLYKGWLDEQQDDTGHHWTLGKKFAK